MTTDDASLTEHCSTLEDRRAENLTDHKDYATSFCRSGLSSEMYLCRCFSMGELMDLLLLPNLHDDGRHQPLAGVHIRRPRRHLSAAPDFAGKLLQHVASAQALTLRFAWRDFLACQLNFGMAPKCTTKWKRRKWI